MSAQNRDFHWRAHSALQKEDFLKECLVGPGFLPKVPTRPFKKDFEGAPCRPRMETSTGNLDFAQSAPQPCG